MSNYNMNTQYQQPQGYYSPEPQNNYAQPEYTQPEYAQPSYTPPNGQYPTGPHPSHQQESQVPGENASYYSGASMDGPGTAEDEKGLGSTIVGGAAGGFAAHEMGGGKMGKLAGAALGAAGMNMATHAMKPKPQPPMAAPYAAPAATGYPMGVPMASAPVMIDPSLPGRRHGCCVRRGLRRAMRRGEVGMLY